MSDDNPENDPSDADDLFDDSLDEDFDALDEELNGTPGISDAAGSDEADSDDNESDTAESSDGDLFEAGPDSDADEGVDDLFADDSSESPESSDGSDTGGEEADSSGETPGFVDRMYGFFADDSGNEAPTADTAADDGDEDDGGLAEDVGRDVGEAAMRHLVILPVWAVAKFVVGASRGIVLALTKVLPKGDIFWKGVMGTALKGMYKTSGADAIGFITRQNGTITPEPVKRKTTESGATRWRAADSKDEFAEGVGGAGFERIGNVPVAFFDEDDYYRVIGPQMRAAEVVDLGQTQDLYSEAVFDAELTVEVSPDANSGGSQPAIADGGAPVEDLGRVQLTAAELHDLGAFEDVVLDYESPGEASGLRRRASKVKELYFQQVPTEEMENQEQRGRIAESDPEAERNRFKKYLLYLVLAVLAARAPEILSMLFGGGGGGGGGGGMGGMVPFFIGGGLL